MPKDFPAGSVQVACAVVVGERNPGTDLKTSLNQALREYELAV
jgi:2,3,4,5-tetrahydropyridine-2-carboxylate N-succinyltransferase